jgi:hypothetical protein
MVAAMSLGSHIFPASGEDIGVLARTIFGEARDQILLGQIAVAWTVRHRAEIAQDYVRMHGGRWHAHYGDGSLRMACKAPDQYSCWNADDPNRPKIVAITPDNPVFQQCMWVALGVVHGQLEDRKPNTTHYLNPKIVKRLPLWVTGRAAPPPVILPAIYAGRIGDHDFYGRVAA